MARKHPSYTVTITVMLFLLPGGVEEVGVEDVRRRKSLLFSFPSQPDEARFGTLKKKKKKDLRQKRVAVEFWDKQCFPWEAFSRRSTKPLRV